MAFPLPCCKAFEMCVRIKYLCFYLWQRFDTQNWTNETNRPNHWTITSKKATHSVTPGVAECVSLKITVDAVIADRVRGFDGGCKWLEKCQVCFIKFNVFRWGVVGVQRNMKLFSPEWTQWVLLFQRYCNLLLKFCFQVFCFLSNFS